MPYIYGKRFRLNGRNSSRRLRFEKIKRAKAAAESRKLDNDGEQRRGHRYFGDRPGEGSVSED
jgi:hypothetical protein